MKRMQLLFFILLSFSLASCSWWGKDDDDMRPYRGKSTKQLYDEAQSAVKEGEYTTAVKRFEALENLYPFNDYAESAQQALIYAYFKKEDYASCAATAERFIHLYPRSKNVDYAFYMKGLANFKQPRGVLNDMFALDESHRDAGTQAQAYADFSTLITQFPNSRYKANALQRMIYLRNQFADREMNVANYYLTRKMYVAAAERASYVVKNYPQSPSAERALALVYQANKAMGLKKAADEALAVYQATYHKTIPSALA